MKLISVLLGVLCLYSLPASAQYINSSPGNAVYASPQGSFGEQPLTTNRRDVTVYVGPFANPKFGTLGDAGLVIARAGDQTAAGLELGAAYGVAKGFEAGLFLPVLQLSPDTSLGDGLPLFVTWAASVQDVDFGFRSTVTIPLEGGDVAWNPGLHGLMRFDNARFDFGAFFPMTFGEPVVAGFDLPLRLAFGFEDMVYVSVQTGLRKGDMVNGANDLFVPLGMGAVVSVPAGSHRLDFGARFEWPGFIWATAPEGTPDIVIEDLYALWFGMVAHFDVAN